MPLKPIGPFQAMLLTLPLLLLLSLCVDRPLQCTLCTMNKSNRHFALLATKAFITEPNTSYLQRTQSKEVSIVHFTGGKLRGFHHNKRLSNSLNLRLILSGSSLRRCALRRFFTTLTTSCAVVSGT